MGNTTQGGPVGWRMSRNSSCESLISSTGKFSTVAMFLKRSWYWLWSSGGDGAGGMIASSSEDALVGKGRSAGPSGSSSTTMLHSASYTNDAVYSEEGPCP